MPWVIVNPPEKRSYNAVMPDDCIVGGRAVEYLFNKGHRKIGYLAGAKFGHVSVAERGRGYMEAMLKYGLTPLSEWERYLENLDDESRLRELLLKSYKEAGCTAVIGYNAHMVMIVMNICLSEGIRVPEDLSIISCDYDSMLDYAYTPVTAIDLDRKEMGVLAAEMIMEKIETNQKSMPTIFIAGTFNERQSVKRIK